MKQNTYEQRMRNYSSRFYNLDSRNMSNMQILRFIYNHFIHPAFELARHEKMIQNIPSFLSTLDVGHPLPTREEGSQKPPITFRFTSRTLKDVFVKYSKTVLNYYNKQNHLRGKNRISTGRDLTEANRSTMARLHDTPSISTCWLSGHLIKFKKFGPDNETPELKAHTVKNPFGHNIDQMLCDVHEPTWIKSYRSKKERRYDYEEEAKDQGSSNVEVSNLFEILAKERDSSVEKGEPEKNPTPRSSRRRSFSNNHGRSRSRSRAPSRGYRREERRAKSGPTWAKITSPTYGGAAGGDYEGYWQGRGGFHGRGRGQGYNNRGNFGPQSFRGQNYRGRK